MRTFSTRLRVKFQRNIKEHIRWLSYLDSSEFDATIKRNYQTGVNLKKLREIAQKVIQTEVYDKYTPTRPRTEDGINSFVSQKTETGLAVFSDPAIATTKGPVSSGNPRSLSYVAFFDDPAFNSFLPPEDDAYDIAKFRPFSEPLERAIYEESIEQSMKAILRAVVKRIPKRAAE
jgi:hypothetical protein